MIEPLKFVNISYKDFFRSMGRLDELYQKARLSTLDDLRMPLREGEMYVAWRADTAVAPLTPALIIGSERDLADLVPRMLAVPGAPIPATSNTKTWYSSDLQSILRVQHSGLAPVAELGFVGLMMFEITSSQEGSDLRAVGIDSVRQTLSFVCARATNFGWHDVALATITQRWLEANTLLKNQIDPSFAVGIAGMCAFVQSLRMHGERDISPQDLGKYIQSWVRLEQEHQLDLLSDPLVEIVRGTTNAKSRERRFDIVTGALDSISMSGNLNPILGGFLISLIEPGSFDFDGLARRYDSRGRLVSAAYFMCTSILGSSETLRKYSGFGITVLNQGLRPAQDAFSDMGFAELRVLHSHKFEPIRYRTRSGTAVDVELAPMVVGAFRTTPQGSSVSPQRDEAAHRQRREQLVKRRLQTAVRALEEAYSALSPEDPVGHIEDLYSRKGLRK